MNSIQGEKPMELEAKIREYLIANLLYVDDAFDRFDNDTSLIGEGLIDSVGVLELVMYAQSAFGITVQQHEMTLDNFDSVNKLARFIRRRQTPVPPAPRGSAGELVAGRFRDRDTASA
jgi:acyl carrier protein